MDRHLAFGGLFVALSAALFGVVVVLGKWAMGAGIAVEAFLSLRFAIAALALAALLLGSRRPLRASRGERLPLLALGGVVYAVEASLFFLGLRHGTAAAVTLLFYTYPALVGVAHVVLGRGRPSPLLTFGLVCSVVGAGVVVASSGGVAIDPVGVGLVLGASVMFTGYLLGSEATVKRTDSLTASLWLCGSAALGLAIPALFGGEAEIPGSWAEVAVVAAMGCATAAAFVSFLAGLRRIGAVRTGVLSTFEPLSAAVFAGLFLGEAVVGGTIVGGLLILTGAVAAVLSSRRAPVEAPLP